MRLFGRRDNELFKLFAKSADMVVQGGEILQEVINDYNNLDEKMARLTIMEHDGDIIINNLVKKLNTSFILPFDREDAFQLVQKLSEVFDYITGIIDRMVLFKSGPPNDRVKEMIDVLLEGLVLQNRAFNLLNKMQFNKKKILDCCSEITRLERKQDNLYRTGLADLFENETDPIVIIKWREVYEHIEMAQDYVQEVGELISNIVVKYS
ncbi:MAG: DUF47 family protein [Syntrophomonadaceae bacterium]|nr:DUF47 family protein [Syntrophomonadaceae bacterium]